MKREIAKIYKEELTKLRKAFKKLRDSNIYAYAKALDFDSSGCQVVIKKELDEKESLRGGIYWNAQDELHLEEIPILHLGFIPRNYDTRDEMMKKALEIAKEANTALNEVGLKTLWNGCVCNTISVILLPGEIIKNEVLEEEKRPCFCEKMWEMQFQQFAEEKLGKLND